MGGGCGPELPVALHSFPAALPREGSCRALQQWLLGCAEPQIPAVCSSSCHPSPLDSPGDQVDSLKHLLPKDSSMAVPQAALLAWYNFWSLGLLATWYARKFTFFYSFSPAFELLYLFKMKARCYINKRTAFPKGKHSSGQKQTL